MLLNFLQQPTSTLIKKYTVADWQILVNQARHHNLLGRVFYLLEKNQLLSYTPEPIIWHFESAFKVSQRQQINTYFEIEEINKILNKHHVVPIYLKGAAYCIRKSSCSFGRIFSDIDVLVSKEQLRLTETNFFTAGWLKTQIDDYDEKYYRIWMHEIPPLQHFKRSTVVDLHHNILPLTNRYVPDMSKFTTHSVENSWFGSATTLSDTDLFIHSAVHLFTESEFDNGLRDLSDLSMLLDEFSNNNTDFILTLIDRANTLGLLFFIDLALRYIEKLLNNENIDRKKINEKFKILNYKHNKIKSTVLDYCFIHVFTPIQPPMIVKSNNKTQRLLASFILFCRSHLMKMPLKILVPHLIKKTIRQIQDLFKQS